MSDKPTALLVESLAKIVSTIRAGMVSTVLTYLHEKAQPLN